MMAIFLDFLARDVLGEEYLGHLCKVVERVR